MSDTTPWSLLLFTFLFCLFIVIFSFTNTNTKGEFHSQKASRFVQTFSCTVDPLNSIQFSRCFLELITFNDPLKKDLGLLGIHPLLSTQPNSPSSTLCLADVTSVASNVSVTTIDESKLCRSWDGYWFPNAIAPVYSNYIVYSICAEEISGGSKNFWTVEGRRFEGCLEAPSGSRAKPPEAEKFLPVKGNNITQQV